MQEDSGTSDQPIDIEHAIMSIYKRCVDAYRWSLRDIDETDLDTLFAFLLFRPDADPNIRIIKGKTYQRAKQAPSWL